MFDFGNVSEAPMPLLIQKAEYDDRSAVSLTPPADE
jgi:hypothetical protein